MNLSPRLDCPKCNGVGRIVTFGHILAGVCFLCGGGKTVTEAEANGWLASVAGRDMVKGGTSSAAAVRSKSVTLPGFGLVSINRCVAAGGFRVDIRGETAFFRVNAGKVAIDEVCNGLRSRRMELATALQGALR